jgi:hypothetical protein
VHLLNYGAGVNNLLLVVYVKHPANPIISFDKALITGDFWANLLVRNKPLKPKR